MKSQIYKRIERTKDKLAGKSVEDGLNKAWLGVPA